MYKHNFPLTVPSNETSAATLLLISCTYVRKYANCIVWFICFQNSMHLASILKARKYFTSILGPFGYSLEGSKGKRLRKRRMHTLCMIVSGTQTLVGRKILVNCPYKTCFNTYSN